MKRSPVTLLRVSLASSLLGIVGASGYELVHPVVIDCTVVTPSWPVLILVEIDLVLAVFLLSGTVPRWSRLAAIVYFVVLACGALCELLPGQTVWGLPHPAVLTPYSRLGLYGLATVALVVSRPTGPAPSAANRPPSAFKRLSVAVAISIVLGVPAGVAIRTYQATRPPLAFLPGEVILADSQHPTVQGELLKIPLCIANISDWPVTVLSLDRSCGCMAVTDASSENEVTVPFRLAPHESHGVQLSVTTSGKSGPSTFLLGAQAISLEGESLPLALFQAKVDVVVPFVAFPRQLHFDYPDPNTSRGLQDRVTIADMRSDVRMGINRIECTNGTRVHCVLENADTGIEYGGSRLCARYQLLVTLPPEAHASDFQGEITVFPERPNADPLRIPVSGKGMRRIAFRPDGLTFCGKSGERATKVLLYTSVDRGHSQIHFAIPKELGMLHFSEQNASDRSKEFAVSCTIPSSRCASVVRAYREDTQETIDIPVRIDVIGD